MAYTLRRCERQPPPCILACEPATESSHPEQGSVRKTDLTASERPRGTAGPRQAATARYYGPTTSSKTGHEKLFTILVCQGHRRSVAVARRDADGSVLYCTRVRCDCADIDAGRNACPGRPCTGLSRHLVCPIPDLWTPKHTFGNVLGRGAMAGRDPAPVGGDSWRSLSGRRSLCQMARRGRTSRRSRRSAYLGCPP